MDIANLKFVVDTQDLDAAGKKVTDLGAATKKVPAIQMKADTTALGTANTQFANLGRAATQAAGNVTNFGRSFDGLKTHVGTLSSIRSSIAEVMTSLVSGDTRSLSRSLSEIVHGFKELHSSGQNAGSQLKETTQVIEHSGSSLLTTVAAAADLTAAYKTITLSTNFLSASEKSSAAVKEILNAATIHAAQSNLKEVASLEALAIAEKKAEDASAHRANNRATKDMFERELGLPRQSAGPPRTAGQVRYTRSREGQIVETQSVGGIREREALAQASAKAAREYTAALQVESNMAKTAAISAGEFATGEAAVAEGAAAMTTAIGASVAVLTVGALAAYAGVKAGIEKIGNEMADAADKADEMAQKMGISTTRLAELEVVAGENATSVDSLIHMYDKISKSMTKFDEDTATTKFALDSLGISSEELAGKTQEQIAGIVVKAWDDLDHSAKATAGAMTFLGPSFRENIPAIKAMSENVDAAAERVAKFGAVASPALVKAGGELEKSTSDMKLAWKGLGNEIALRSEGMTTSINNWASNMIAKITSALKIMRESADKADEIANSSTLQERQAMMRQARTNLGPRANQVEVNAEFQRIRGQAFESTNQENARETSVLGRKNAVLAEIEAKRIAKLKAASDAATKGDKGASGPGKSEIGSALLSEKEATIALQQEYVSLFGIKKQTYVQDVEAAIASGKYNAVINEQGKVTKLAATELEKKALLAQASDRDALVALNERTKLEQAAAKVVDTAVTAEEAKTTALRQTIAEQNISRAVLAQFGKTQEDVNLAVKDYNLLEAERALAVQLSVDATKDDAGYIDNETRRLAELVKQLREQRRLTADDLPSAKAAGLKEKADAIRAQIEPNFTIMKQLKEINDLEAQGALTAKEAAKARLELTVQLQGDQATFIDGWTNAFDQYRQNAQTAAGAAAEIFKSATSSMEDAIVNFAMTGSLSFAKFAQSVLASMVQIAARRAALGLVSMLGSAFTGGTSAGSSIGSSGLGYVIPRAGGGDVSAGQAALVGEQGPEVLRMGTLGAHVFPNTSSESGVHIEGGINVTVQGGQTNAETGTAVSKSIMDTMKTIARGEMVEQKRPGGILYGA